MRKVPSKGFTLLEILLVIAGIGILATIVIVAINPQKQLEQARDVTDISEVDSLAKALDQRMVDLGMYDPEITPFYQELCAVAEGTGCLDLYNTLVPLYLPTIPRHRYATGDGSGYEIAVHPDNNRISIRVKPSTEILQIASINPFDDIRTGSIEISNSIAQDLTNYVIRVILPHQEGMQNTFSDVKFQDGNAQLLDFWLETYTEGDSSIFWVKVPVIEANDDIEIDYVYRDTHNLEKESQLEDVLLEDSIFLQTRLCNVPNLCHFTDNHTEFEQLVANQYTLFGSGIVNQINHTANPYGASDYYWKRYTVLFVPTQTGVHTFRTSSDDASEIVIRTAGDLASEQVVAHWYGGHGGSANCTSGTSGTYNLIAGEPVWIEYRMQELTGGQIAYGCINDGNGMRLISSTHFPGQLFTRTIVYPEPNVVVNPS